jgi:uncharacterized membrane protein
MSQQAPPTQVILAAFKDEDGADKALEQLKAAKKEHLITIPNVAVLRKDAEGKLHIKEPTDMGAGRGAVIGGVLGGLTGLAFGPIGLAAVGGAAIGGIIARLRDSGFKDERLRQLGESLQPRSSAILAVIEHIWVLELEAELQKAGADTVTAELSADIAAQLKEGKDVAYTAVAAGDTIGVARVTTSENSGSTEAPAPGTTTAAETPKPSTPPNA